MVQNRPLQGKRKNARKTVRSGSFNIRHCNNLEELQNCVDLQKSIWGFTPQDIVPAAIFAVSSKTGGHCLGAFDGSRQIGFALAFPGLRPQGPYLHSHMLGVLPSYQNHGIGRRLKLKQRAEALRRKIELIEWTFDPLELRNSYFNIVRLGVIVRRFMPNVYGPSTSPLQANLPTDRMVAEWWLTTPRVKACVAGKAAAPANGAIRVSVPADIREIKKLDKAKARKLQTRLRNKFTDLFGKGYAVTGFVLDSTAGVYLLEKYEN